MKVTCPAREITVTQKNLANYLGISPARICKLVKEGTVIRDESDESGGVFFGDSIRNYWIRKNEIAESDDDVDINLERAKREAAERKIAELKLAKMENRVYDARVVELVQTEMLSNLRTQLLGLPAKLAPIIEGKSRAEVYEILTKEIEEKLGELSEYTPEQYTREEIGDGDEE